MMKRVVYTHAQRIMLVRKIGRLVANGMRVNDAAKKVGVSAGSYSTWKRWAGTRRDNNAPMRKSHSNGKADATAAAEGLLGRLSQIESEWAAFKVALGVTEADIAPKS